LISAFDGCSDSRFARIDAMSAVHSLHVSGVAMEQRPVEVRDQQSRVGVVTHATIAVMESYRSEMCLALRDDPRMDRVGRAVHHAR
jgi:hypothetical protein